MDMTWAALILIGGLLLLLALGVEIAVSMGIIATVGLVVFVGQPLQQFAYSGWEIVNSFVLTAMPLFVFMGAILANTGIAGDLFRAADKWLGGLPGGIACSVIGANAVFGAMSGSSVAATATFGKIAFPEMEKLGYEPKLALGSIAVAGTLSVLIPPSLLFIVYGAWEGVSVARLFAAGLIPGIVLAVLLMVTVMVRVRLNPRLAPTASTPSRHERFATLPSLLPFLAIIALVLGVVFTGVMTPTESAALGAFLSIVLAAVRRRLSLTILRQSMEDAVKISAMVAFVLFTARVLGMVFAYLGVTKALAAGMLTLPLDKYGMLAVICLLYLVLGSFFDTFSMMVLTLPFVSPIVAGSGFDAIWFGVVFVILAEIGLVTPPFGLNLFVLNGAVPKHDVMTIAAACLPLLPALLLLVVLLTLFPQLALWLPEVLYSH